MNHPQESVALVDRVLGKDVIGACLHGSAVFGGLKPASDVDVLVQVLDPVPHADLIRASVAGIPDLLDDLEGDTRNVLLTLARIWTTLATGHIRSKDAAADWALAQLPPEHRPVLEHARHLYLNCRYSGESWSETLRAQVRPHVDQVLAHIDRLHSQSGEPLSADGTRRADRGA
ncbi:MULTISPECIES: aminoglycoside adenylyltransferase domain-containing protein [unclassified Streptomyces]|uniref:aminoglycoside adenylyltransferase domain-containing protein n=1 Tax=unclassified Streptomyces TaxID=2593676 RepID=UPI001CBB246D|nr:MULTISPECIES: aminoglycoside adenylyltransferase domain-containing protein [unclassified Streptomyces]WPO73248.1 DUF4111 domain-containing protein [Streptomyces sp. KN37]